MKKINCLIADDEEIAKEILQDYILKLDKLKCPVQRGLPTKKQPFQIAFYLCEPDWIRYSPVND